MVNQQDNAAFALMGMTLNKRWQVVKRLEPLPGASGGFFSVCYIVKDGEKIAFLKALNFKAFFQLFNGKSVVEILNEQTNAFKYEKELLIRCKSNRLSKVSLIIDEGEEFVDGFTISNVPYLIFEMADGDVRSHMNFSKQVESAWKLKSLHDVAVGLKQLHSIQIGHQDLKPSNVLLYEKGLTSKIGDLGRSLCANLVAPHENGGHFPGDFGYAPPEFLYRFIEPNWNNRIKATDLYLFGSLIVFYFTGANMTALLGKNIDKSFRWDHWTGTFEDVQDYLIEGFYKAINEFKLSIANNYLSKDLVELVEYCCFPLPGKRGHPKSIKEVYSQFDLQRVISKMDILYRKAKFTVQEWQ